MCQIGVIIYPGSHLYFWCQQINWNICLKLPNPCCLFHLLLWFSFLFLLKNKDDLFIKVACLVWLNEKEDWVSCWLERKQHFRHFEDIVPAMNVQCSSECLMLTCTCSVVSVSAADDIKYGLNGADNIKLRVKEKVRSRQNQGTLWVWNWLHNFKTIYRRLIFKPTKWWVYILACPVES